ncbi:biliverdin-producing heme oxygenase [Bradyrhizobium oligotrophicum]|uniref:biliverdin-producing heme oxygenase n=1 Tax=Bradyrhizobium oligotrophicum TaxID=44255 RepID=UPI0005AB5CEE|nr:biliverdin-producing heme oxygenase [Bradyrhizobium oligotrophicum]
MQLAAVSDDPSRAPSTQGLRHRLKAATAAAHHALDERLGQFDLTTTAHYRRFLQASAAALLPLEAALEHAGVAACFDDWARRRRSPAIMADLADLGGVAIPMSLPVQRPDRAFVFGTLYVLEGSRLGAAYLLRVVAASADPKVRRAIRYLGHGAGVGLWHSFLSQLSREPATPDDEVRMIESAREAFAVFAQAVACA